VTFRDGLLDGRRVAVAGPGTGTGEASADGGDDAVIDRLRALGARVEQIDPQTLRDEDAAAAWERERAPLDALVFLAAEPFGDGGADRLQATLELGWRAARGAQLHASGQGGRLVFVAPRAAEGRHAEAARAGLENLARTLSVEWARFGVTAVAITPGSATAETAVAELVSYLLSPAGGYFSGCRFSLGEVAPARGV
jgi:NAD(P)-dependent dehydrogenase (short-subunit alcohol dehydrogenase family)